MMLKIEKLSFSYNKEKNILDRLNFKIQKPEIIALLGSNGAGKTTLLKCILGILNMDKGDIILNDRNLNQMSKKDRAKEIAYVPQFMDLVFSITVFDFIMLGSEVNRTIKNLDDAINRTASIIELFELNDIASQDMLALSGGQKQRIYIARAVAQGPKVLLLDEPTSNLDVKYQKQTFEILKDLKNNEEMTILISIHDLNLAAKYCDRFIVLKRGRVFADGLNEQVYTPEIIEEIYELPVEIISHEKQKVVIIS